MTDFRALCVELTDALDKLNCSFNVPNQSGLVERASAALAEPEPDGPTDEELLEEWRQLMGSPRAILAQPMLDFARAVLARWGYDQRVAVDEAKLQKARDEELEACCEWLVKNDWKAVHKHLRAARRPKPPSLADEALEQLRGIETCVLAMHGGDLIDDVIHAALKRLKELESNNELQAQ